MRRQFFFGILTVIAAFALFSAFSTKPSGCPVKVDNSTEDAQVFLMGTIGGAYEDPNRDCWREDFVQPVLDELGVTYFNPVVSNWTEESAEIEARVIAQAETIVMVITASHPSIGSLAESGWAVLSSIERGQTIIIYIAPDSANEESWRARQIVLSQARPLAENLDNVIIVDSLYGVVAALREHYRN
jgi:hypothetical protein